MPDVSPREYRDALALIAAAHSLEPSSLRPVTASDIIAVERELGRTLPDEYATFLVEIGCGDEYGGLARWFHFDITEPGNVLEESTRFQARGNPRGFLAVYDPFDGDVYGFLPMQRSYRSEPHSWNQERRELRQLASSFSELLDELVAGDVEVVGGMVRLLR